MSKFTLNFTTQPEYFSLICGCSIPEYTYGMIEGFENRFSGNNESEIVNNAIDFLKGKGLKGILHISR